MGWFNDNVVKPLADAFSAIGKWIWEHLPDWLKNAITTVQDWFSGAKDWITKGWQDFVDWVSKIPEHIQNLGNYIYDNAIKPLQNWLDEQIISPFSEYIVKPLEDVGATVWQTLSSAFDRIRNAISEFLKDPIGFIGGIFNFLISGLKKIGEAIWLSLIHI